MAPYADPMRRLRQIRPFNEWLPVVDLPTLEPEDNHRKIAAERWEFIPSFRDLLDAMDALGAVFVEADEPNIRVLIGIMLDGLPSAKTLPSAGYIDALTFMLANPDSDDDEPASGFSALAVAATIVEVWRTKTFVPAPAEFLTLAAKKQFEFRRAYIISNRLYDLREQAEVVLIHFGDIKPEAIGDDDIPF
jgi:hypothetical protein